MKRKKTVRLCVDREFAKKMKISAVNNDMTIVGFSRRLASEDAPRKAISNFQPCTKITKKQKRREWDIRI